MKTKLENRWNAVCFCQEPSVRSGVFIYECLVNQGMMKAAAASICDTFTAVAIFMASDWILMFIKDWVHFSFD